LKNFLERKNWAQWGREVDHYHARPLGGFGLSVSKHSFQIDAWIQYLLVECLDWLVGGSEC
jgi:hypothetical protein